MDASDIKLVILAPTPAETEGLAWMDWGAERFRLSAAGNASAQKIVEEALDRKIAPDHILTEKRGPGVELGEMLRQAFAQTTGKALAPIMRMTTDPNDTSGLKAAIARTPQAVKNLIVVAQPATLTEFFRSMAIEPHKPPEGKQLTAMAFMGRKWGAFQKGSVNSSRLYCDYEYEAR